VVLATIGFVSWALPPFVLMQTMVPALTVGVIGLYLSRALILGKVFVAMGLILLVLEDEVEQNQWASGANGGFGWSWKPTRARR